MSVDTLLALLLLSCSYSITNKRNFYFHALIVIEHVWVLQITKLFHLD